MQAAAYPQPQPIYQPSENDKKVGSKFNKAFLITVLFLVLSHSYKVLDNIYFLFTQKQFELFNPELYNPTGKGYVVVTLLFFIIVFLFML